MVIEVKIKCLNPGCDINYKVDDPAVDAGFILKAITEEVISVMNNRELKKNSSDLFTPSSLTISTSDSFTAPLDLCDPKKSD